MYLLLVAPGCAHVYKYYKCESSSTVYVLDYAYKHAPFLTVVPNLGVATPKGVVKGSPGDHNTFTELHFILMQYSLHHINFIRPCFILTLVKLCNNNDRKQKMQ